MHLEKQISIHSLTQLSTQLDRRTKLALQAYIFYYTYQYVAGTFSYILGVGGWSPSRVGI